MREYMKKKRETKKWLSIERKTDNKKKKKNRSSWEKKRRSYERNIRLGFTVPCQCCGRLWPPDVVQSMTKDELIFDGFCQEFTDYVFALDNNDSGKFCGTCKSSIKDQRIPRFCLNNGLRFPKVDKEIAILNRIEERLISPSHVFQSIWPVMGPKGQFKTKGAIVNIPVNVDTTVSSLPRPAQSTNIIHLRIARKLEYKNDFMSGFVRTKKVYDAAKVIVNKPLFKELGVQLSDESVISNDTPMNMDDVDSDNSSIDTDYEYDRNVFCNETMITSDEGYRIAPAEGHKPRSILLDENVDFLAFPKIYGGFKMTPDFDDKPMSYSDFAKSVAMQRDRRIASRSDYLLFMAKKLELLKLNSNVSTCIRKKVMRRGQTVTAGDMLDSSFINALIQHDDGFKVLKGIRSSAAHWQNEKSKVLAMIRQFGLPTLFVTLSSADTRWPELLVQLKKNVDNETITEEEATELTYDEKSRLIQTDPMTCVLHFDRRFKSVKQTWNTDDGPFGKYKISHFYHRIEFQHRGSPHVHMLLWLDGAPLFDPKNKDTWTEVCFFVNSIISVSKNTVSEDLLNLQRHKHTRTCQKKFKKDECRFGIPFYPMIKTKILAPLEESYPEEEKDELLEILERIKKVQKEEESQNVSFEDFLKKCNTNYKNYILSIRASLKNFQIFLKRTPGEMFINAFSPKLLQTMRSNQDCQ